MDQPGIVMNRIFAKHWVAPLNRRDGWRLLVAVVVTLGASAACTAGDSGRADGDAVGTRLSRVAVTIDSLGVDFGTSEAPLRVIEFFDYGCGYCRAFHQNTRGPLHEQYVDPGRVFWKSIPFVIGTWPASVPVSLAAECARDQGRGYFEAISALIFAHQSDWKAASAPEELAEGFAEEVGLDMVRYRTCFENDELLWRVQAHTAFAEELGVRGTPTFYLLGWGPITGALPLEAFQQVIDTVLVEAAAGQL